MRDGNDSNLASSHTIAGSGSTLRHASGRAHLGGAERHVCERFISGAAGGAPAWPIPEGGAARVRGVAVPHRPNKFGSKFAAELSESWIFNSFIYIYLSECC